MRVQFYAHSHMQRPHTLSSGYKTQNVECRQQIKASDVA